MLSGHWRAAVAHADALEGNLGVELPRQCLVDAVESMQFESQLVLGRKISL